MSDAINMEDDGPALETPPAPDAAAPPEPPAEPEAQPAEVEAVEVGGQKYVPLAAVIAERKEKQALKEAATKAAQLEQELAQARPYVDFLKAHPELTQPRQPEPAVPTQDTEALDYAKDFDLYTADGKPDVDKARRILDRETARVQKVAQSAIAPVQQVTDAQASAVLYQQALQTKGTNGATPDPQVLAQLWQSVPPRLSKDPGVAALLHAAAIGFSKQGQAPIPPPAAPPLVTEGGGRVTPRAAVLSDIDKRIAANRGLDEDKFGKLSAGFVKGRTNQLED